MLASERYGWGRKALAWLCLFILQLGLASGMEAAAEKMPFTSEVASASVEEHPPCVVMERRVDMNVLATMTTEQLEYLQASLCPSGGT